MTCGARPAPHGLTVGHPGASRGATLEQMAATTGVERRHQGLRLTFLNVAKSAAILAALFYLVICAVLWITDGDPGLTVVAVAVTGGGALVALRWPIAGGLILALFAAVMGLFTGAVVLMLTTAENALRDALPTMAEIAGPALIAGVLLIIAGSRARTREPSPRS